VWYERSIPLKEKLPDDLSGVALGRMVEEAGQQGVAIGVAFISRPPRHLPILPS